MHAASPRHQLAVELFCFVSDEAAAAAGSRSSVSASVDCPNKTAQLQHARSLRQLWSNWPNFNGAAAVAPSTEISLELRHLFAVTSSGDSIVYDEGNGPTGSDPFHLHFFTRCAMRSDRINCCADGQCDTVVLWRSPQVYSRIVKRDEEKNNIKRNGSAIFLKS